MGRDKRQLNKLLEFVKDLYEDPDNKEFAAGLRSVVMEDLKETNIGNRIAEIYEYCIQQILKKQAESFYDDFPLTDIKSELVSDYIKMERAHRDNNIDDFGIRLYRQIENIVRTLSKDKKLESVVECMMDEPFFVNGGVNPQVQNRQKKSKDDKHIMSIADIVLIPSSRYSSIEDRKKKPLSEQYATDMARLVIYFVCFGGMMTGAMYEQWRRQTDAYSNIYSIRNHVHGGGEISEYCTNRYNEVMAHAGQSYFRLMSFLVFLVDGVKKGLDDELVEYASKKFIDTEVKSMLPSACYVQFNGKSEKIPDSLWNKVKNLKVGDKVTLTVFCGRIKDVNMR